MCACALNWETVPYRVFLALDYPKELLFQTPHDRRYWPSFGTIFYAMMHLWHRGRRVRRIRLHIGKEFRGNQKFVSFTKRGKRAT